MTFIYILPLVLPLFIFVELTFLLKGGTYLVVNGGSNISVNQHLLTLDASMVLTALDGLPDMQVPQADREHMGGNHALLREIRCKQD